MQEVTFDLQVLTPLFISGANQHEVPVPPESQRPDEVTSWELLPEIRPPSFRGLMRYWLRAAVAGVAPLEIVSLEDIRAFECSIFGATDQGSAVQVRIIPLSDREERFRKESYSRDHVSGRDYLYWSMARSGRGKRYKPNRLSFSEGTRFKVTLAVHDRGGETPIRQLECAVAALWLLTSLGGIGSRSRRCAGSLTVPNVSGNTTPLSFTQARTAEELQRTLRQGLQVVQQLYSRQLAAVKAALGTPTDPPLEGAPFDTLSLPKSCRIWILQRKDGFAWRRAKDALDDIGKELQACRNSIALPERTTLGLPLIVQRMERSKLQKALEENRRASPLLLTIKQLQGQQYVGVAVLFKTHYESIEPLPEPDYTLIEEWIEQRLLYTTALEVTL